VAGAGHPSAVRLLVSDTDAAWRVAGNALIVDVPRIDDHEIVVVHLAKAARLLTEPASRD
jgi:hypothetical protein